MIKSFKAHTLARLAKAKEIEKKLVKHPNVVHVYLGDSFSGFIHVDAVQTANDLVKLVEIADEYFNAVDDMPHVLKLSELVQLLLEAEDDKELAEWLKLHEAAARKPRMRGEIIKGLLREIKAVDPDDDELEWLDDVYNKVNNDISRLLKNHAVDVWGNQ